MHLVNRAIADALCCFTFHNHDDLQQPAKLQKMPAKTRSPASVSTPCTTLPTTYDSPDALQDIFASSSSARGYHAVRSMPAKHSAPQGSLDLNFRFGSENPKKKPSSRLEQLTNHVKHQLSETYLSKSHEDGDAPKMSGREKPAASPTAAGDSVAAPLSRSQGSLGLTELLASRTASEGGYDSDARSIHSPMTLSIAGTLKIGPRFVRKSLATIEGSQVDDQPSFSDRLDTPAETVPHSSPKTAMEPSPLPTTPTQTSFVDACQVGPGESPKDVLRRLSEGIANGTIKMPRTPELRATRMSDFHEPDANWSLSLSAPPRASSLGKRDSPHDGDRQGDQEIKLSIKHLADYVLQAKRSSHGSAAQDSLISQLDQSLLGYMERFANDEMHAETVPSSPVTAIAADTEPCSKSANSVNHGTIPDPEAANTSEHDVTSIASSKAHSVHLFNMRISHRLASTSRVPMMSSALHSESGSSASLVVPLPTSAMDVSRPPSNGRMPSFIAFEHTRRPSDPQTKKLFEQGPGPGQSDRLRMRSLSDGNSAGKQCGLPKGHAIVDDSSSYYGSVVEGLSNVSQSSTRSDSIKNVHSLAIGGRSVSGSLLRHSGEKSVGRFLDGVEIPWSHKTSLKESCRSEEIWETPQEVLQAKQTVNMRKQSKYLKVDSTPTPVGRRFYNSTEANEGMSEIGVDRALESDDSFSHSLDSESRAILNDETFSDTNRSGGSLGATDCSADTQTAEGWLSQGRRQGWNYGFKDATPVKKQARSSEDLQSVEGNRQDVVEDSASNVWHKAFKRIGESEDHGRLLATPKFDAEGRRKSLIKSSNDGSRAADTAQGPLISPTQHRRSQSADLERSHVFASDAKLESYRRKSVPTLDNISSRSIPKKKQQRFGKSKMKRSFGDLGRLVTKTTILETRGKSQSLKSPFSVWGRFPSHTREQRNGPAGPEDDIKAHDFYRASTEVLPAESGLAQVGNSSASVTASPRKAWRVLTLKEPGLRIGRTKSMTFTHLAAERAKRRRKGLGGKIRRLYRTKSSQFHAYAMTKGHRSSISVSSCAEFPELECLPGEGAFAAGRVENRASESGLDGTSERHRSLSLETISETASKRSRSMLHLTVPRSKRDAEEWSKLYQECVGSLSALKSENDLRKNGKTAERRILSMSSALRESTVDFHAKLSQDADRVKEELLEQLQTSRESESEGLKMPGSFV